MDASISTQLKEITEQLIPLKSLSDPLWTQPEFVGAALASTVALGIALFGEPIRKNG